jgi:hypothetical protein
MVERLPIEVREPPAFEGTTFSSIPAIPPPPLGALPLSRLARLFILPLLFTLPLLFMLPRLPALTLSVGGGDDKMVIAFIQASLLSSFADRNVNTFPSFISRKIAFRSSAGMSSSALTSMNPSIFIWLMY